MQRIFIGLLFALLNFNLNLGNITIELIPDFLGYYFILQGLRSMRGTSPRFDQCIPFCNGMFIYCLILFLAKLTSLTVNLGLFSYLLGWVATAVSLFVTYCIAQGVKQLEALCVRNLAADELYRTWLVQAIAVIAANLLIFVPILAIVSVIIGIVGAILYLIAFNRSKNFYEQPTYYE